MVRKKCVLVEPRSGFMRFCELLPVWLLSLSLLFGLRTPLFAVDFYDTVLLTTSLQGSCDINFSKISEHYGLRCKVIDLSTTALTDSLLRDENGEYLKAAFINNYTPENPAYLDPNEIGILKEAVETGGVSLLVLTEEITNSRESLLKKVTDNVIIGATYPADSSTDYVISDSFPEITREFTGLKLSHAGPQTDFAITLSPNSASNIDIIVSATDDSSKLYPIFGRYRKGKGSIFILGTKNGKSLQNTQMEELYDTQHFSKIVPIMMFLRYSSGDEVWHKETDYANLTIDDPFLVEPYGNLEFKGLLTSMQTHDFHTTIAFIPWNYDRSNPKVVRLFLDHSDRFSIAIHGNNHDHYEFYKYGKVPLKEQQKDIIQALHRMEEFKKSTGIPYDKIMIFPHGIAPAKTLELLKRNDFVATVNNQDVPLETKRPESTFYGMEPAIMDYANFALLKRCSAQGYRIWSFKKAKSDIDVAPYAFDLFIDKPVLILAHQDFFVSGIDAFNSTADKINDLAGEIRWTSLGDILKHLYLEKTNDDGSVDVRMYGNKLVLSNKSGSKRLYHIRKKETLSLPTSKVTINGVEANYIVENDTLKVDEVIPLGESLELEIIYNEEIPSIANFPTGSLRNIRKSGFTVWILRRFSDLRDIYLSTNRPGRAIISLYYIHRRTALGIAGACGLILISVIIFAIVKVRGRWKE